MGKFLRIIIFGFFIFVSALLSAQKVIYTHADSLKGSLSKQRIWWDALHYDLHVNINPIDSSISGYNTITYKVLEPMAVMQLDLMAPMIIDSVIQNGISCNWISDGNAHFVSLALIQHPPQKRMIRIYFHGKPRSAKMPPWDGGLVWSKDAKGNPWISIACQGMAAQVWFPNKDHMYDEPDSASIYITCPKNLVAVSNGRLRSVKMNADETATYNWAVVNPINNYNIIPYIGKYVYLKDTINGLNGPLDMAFWVLEDNFEKAKKQILQAKSMLHCFEYWFGPYPFYEDGYKLVEAPFLGMEHQSAIAYGNDFQNGYRGRDLSQTGWGLKWDFIIVHESGHEWFGNNISARDVADNWIHESFTAYSENLYTEYLFGKQAGAEYVFGTRKAILNDKNIIGDYNVNNGGSNDLYYKGANMLHTIRQIVDNDSLWRSALIGLNKTFWHKTVTTKQIEEYLSFAVQLQLQPIFDQYLRTTKIPVLEYRFKKEKLFYRWANCVKDFDMPISIKYDRYHTLLRPTVKWQEIPFKAQSISADENFYVNTLNLSK